MKKQHSRKPKPCYKPLSGFRAAASKILRRCASSPAICINGKPAARICRPQKLIASPCIRMQEITGKATNTTGSGAGCAGRQCGMSHRGTERAWTLKIRRWIVITALAGVITRFSENIYVQKAFMGIRVCVAVLVVNAIVKLWKSAIDGKVTIAVFLSVLLASVFLPVSPALIVVIVVALGILFELIHSRRATG